MSKAELFYVYCFNCKELLFKGKQSIALGYSDAIKSYPVLLHKGHNHIVGNLWYINQTHPEIDTTGWEEKSED